MSFPEVKSRKKFGESDGRVSKAQVPKRETSPVPPMDAIFTAGIRPALDPKTRIQSLKNNVHVSAQESIHDLVPLVPSEIVRRAVIRTVKAFPELNFFHLPTVLQSVGKLHPLLVGAVLAHAAFFDPISELNDGDRHDKWLGAESFLVTNYIYEKLTLEAIFNDYTFLLRPDLDIARALLLLSVVKWGHSEYYASWMLHGCAVRMVQSLDFDEAFNSRARQSIVLEKMKERTFWCAFALDRIISTGQNRIFVITQFKDIPFPTADHDFSMLTVGQPNDNNIIEDVEKMGHKFTPNSFLDTCEKYPQLIRECPFTAFLMQYAIWGEINNRFMKGNKELARSERPWDPDSGLYKIARNLEKFWAVIPNDWKWTTESFETSNLIFKKDTMLLVINCLYYLSIMLMHREFLPFLPYDIEKPMGPSDSQRLTSPPSEDYWVESARTYFQATRNLGSLLDAMLYDAQKSPPKKELLNAALVTPFYSFAAFACAIAASYGWNYYWMDPDHEKYSNNINNPRCLQKCYSRMVELLKAKEDSCSVTKNWLSISIKFQEINKFVAENRERAKQLDWGKPNLKDLKHSLDNLNTDLKNIEKSFPLLPPPFPHQQNTNSKMDNIFAPSNVEHYQYSQSLYPIGPNTTSYQQMSFMPPHSSFVPASYPQNAQHSHSSHGSSHNIPSPSNGNFSSQSTQASFSRQSNLPSNPSSSHQPPYAQYHAGSQPLLYPSSISQSSNGDIGLDLETDKLNLFFNDQELDLLLQFKG